MSSQDKASYCDKTTKTQMREDFVFRKTRSTTGPRKKNSKSAQSTCSPKLYRSGAKKCGVNKQHDCLYDQYCEETNEVLRSQIVLKAIHQNAALRAEVQLLKELLSVH